jgi:diadenosine tetraphosphate (Ap4A) HIT family hydrolase
MKIASALFILSTICFGDSRLSGLANKVEHADVHKDGCLFCLGIEKDRLSVIKYFKYCMAVEDKFPVSKGHVLILPYQHIENYFEAPEEVRQNIVAAADEIKEYLNSEYSPDGYNFGTNCGAVAGQTVMHLHWHLIPRYAGDRERPTGIATGIIPNDKNY